MKTKEKGSWIVLVRCEVEREVICDNCTEEEARQNPFAHSIQERDIQMPDYHVKRVEPNA